MINSVSKRGQPYTKGKENKSRKRIGSGGKEEEKGERSREGIAQEHRFCSVYCIREKKGTEAFNKCAVYYE